MTASITHHTPTAQPNDPTYDVSANAWNEGHDATIAHSDLTGVNATDHHAAAVAGPDADITVDAAGAAGTASTFARSAHGHKLATSASAPAAVSTAASAGTSGHAPSRDDHVHAHETAHVAHDTIWDTAGDLVQATGADAAAKLAISVPAANILNVVGVVNGETTWSVKSVHDGTAPVTQAMGDAAAAGTALTAAHRDHKHGMPALGYGLVTNATPAVSLTTAEAFITATTSISASTYADITGASITLAAGTWLILATIVGSALTTTASILVAAITDNANAVIAEASQGAPAGTATVAQNLSVQLSAIVTPAGSTTYKLRAARGTTTYTATIVIMDGSSLNTANNTTDNSDKGTSIRAVRIA